MHMCALVRACGLKAVNKESESESVSVIVLCLGQCKSMAFESLWSYVKGVINKWNISQSYIINWDVRCPCCRWRWFHVLLFWVSSSNCHTHTHLVRESPLLRKLKSAFANKNSSLIQTMISFIFVKIYRQTLPVLWMTRKRENLFKCHVSEGCDMWWIASKSNLR